MALGASRADAVGAAGNLAAEDLPNGRQGLRSRRSARRIVRARRGMSRARGGAIGRPAPEGLPHSSRRMDRRRSGGGAGGPIVGAWATRPSKVLCIEIAAFRRVAARDPELWRHLVLLGLHNQRRLIGLAQDLMLRRSRQRLAALLARLAGLREDHPPADPAVDATQGEIGAIANLSRGVVSRLLLEMEEEGLVRLRRASVEILDPDRLLQDRAPL
jgi:hypothetical protein